MALIAGGASPNVADNEGNTPLHLCNSPELMTALLEAEADPNATNKVGTVNSTPLATTTIIAATTAATATAAAAAAVNTTSTTTTTHHHQHQRERQHGLHAQHNSLTLMRRYRCTLLLNRRPAKRLYTHPSHPS